MSETVLTAPRATEAASDAGACYLYGIAKAGPVTALPSITGIAGAPVRLVEALGMAAVLSDLSPTAATRIRSELAAEDLASTRQALEAMVQAHARVVAEVFASTAIVPLRFGALFASAGAVAAMLRSEQTVLSEVLSRLDGAAEWAVRVTWDAHLARDALVEQVPPGPDGRSSGRAYLAARKREQDARQHLGTAKRQLADAIHRRLSEHARQAVLCTATRPSHEPAAAPGLVLDAAYLVDHHDGALATQLEQELAAGQVCGLRAQLTGPWPPYSFVRLRIGDGS